ncbi:galactoside 2-alpha-L-fucosyltransferase-like [Mercurialis annua]|uniref:galactoside 2-alpha-L-fucosyltransferase-like n=1 Tax=Mercurialis annua TaxID=3986 RepID=UPI00215F19FB|nr:galactoside 2-alpha-L-fucosyltransferase-like [Mercurialis annua]
MEVKPLKKLLESISMRPVAFGSCLIAFPLMIILSITYQDQMFSVIGGFAGVTIFGGNSQNVTEFGDGPEYDSSWHANFSDDQLLGGLLASGFNTKSCLSRYRSFRYRKSSPHKPSPYLLLKLRNYENLHKHCGPYTEAYNRTLETLNSSNFSSPAECKYMIWIGEAGLGNRILTTVSAFLYSLLTNRTLLVQHGPDMADLFCEPFLNTSWLLPADFPLKNEFEKVGREYPNTYGNMVKNHAIGSPISVLYLFLASGCNDFDKLFYCEEDQAFLQKIPWLIMKSDEYFTPSFFLMPGFEHELNQMFPDKETIFHHLGRYLLHPSNKAWGLIIRFYKSYLANTDERIGMQIRVFNPKDTPFQEVTEQILACTKQENLIPDVDKEHLVDVTTKNQTSTKAILIASLYSEFYENFKNMYWTFPTITGETVEVVQPSHETYQHFGDSMHNVKAWVEMNLLSMTDVLVTSSWSTFGYVAQGLGGLKPWILTRPEFWMNTDPACRRVMSMEPCLHIPPSFDCKTKVNADMGNVVPYVQHCEDVTSGLKLVNNFTG